MSVQDLLIIFVPGYYIHIIDCGSSHATMRSLELADPSLVPSLPAGELGATSPDLLSLSSMMLAPLAWGGVLDVLTGLAFTISVDESALHTLFTRPRVVDHVRALHLVLVHLKSNTLAESLLERIISSSPDLVSPALIKEFVIASAYAAMESTGISPSLLETLPLSTRKMEAETYDPHARVSRTSGSYAHPSTTSSTSSGGEGSFSYSQTPSGSGSFDMSGKPVAPAPTRFSLQQPVVYGEHGYARSGAGTSSGSGTSSPSGVKRLFLKLFSMDSKGGDGKKKKRKSSHMGSVYDPILELKRVSGRSVTSDQVDGPGCSAGEFALDWSSNHHLSLLTEHLVEGVSSKALRSSCARWASEYQSALLSAGVRVFRIISSAAGTGNLDPFDQFALLEVVYSALEELSAPFPPGFHTLFAMLGFQTLPRSAFLLYLDRNVFRITPSFVLEASHVLGDSEEDNAFRARLGRALSNPVYLDTILSEDLEYMAARASSLCIVPTVSPGSASSTVYNTCDGFVPASLYLRQLDVLVAECGVFEEDARVVRKWLEARLSYM